MKKTELQYARSLIRRLIRAGREYVDNESCVFCEGIDENGFINCGRHHPKCPGNEGRKYLIREIKP